VIKSVLTFEQGLDQALSQWPAWCRARPKVIRPLIGGLTNISYLLNCCGQQLVLRINAVNGKALDLDRPAEVAVLKAAEKAGITAKLIYSDPAYRYMVTEYVVAETWPAHYSNTNNGLEQLAALLRSIHRLEVAAPLLDNELKAERYWQSIDHSGEVPKQLLALSAKLKGALRAAKALNNNPCLCHNDLLAANLLLTAAGRLYAIDWEYAAIGDAYFDLAAVIEGHGLSGNSIDKLMRAYHCDAIEAIDGRRLRLAKISFCYLDLLWYCAQSTLQATQDYNMLMAKKLNQLKYLLSISV